MFGVEWLTNTMRIAAAACPGVTLHQVAWEIPLSTISYYVAMGCRTMGVKNVKRQIPAELIGARSKQLMLEWVAQNEP
jgi:hypothetical protein